MNSSDLDWIEPLPEGERPVDTLERVADATELRLYNVVRKEFDDQSASSLVSRRRLADELGVSTSLISRWLIKPSNMTVRSAAKLLYTMGKDLDFTVTAYDCVRGARFATSAPQNGGILHVAVTNEPKLHSTDWSITRATDTAAQAVVEVQ